MQKLLLTFAFSLLSIAFIVGGQKDESPGFFLKLAKNVPRIGRRTDKEYESYFLKNSKQIPRIGRNTDNFLAADGLMPWLNEVTQPIKRVLTNPLPLSLLGTIEREYSVVQPVNSNTLIELIEKDAIQSENVKFVHWKDFDRALQEDTDLYNKVISLGRKPDRSLREDLGIGTSINHGSENKFYNGLDPYLYERNLLHYNNELN